jgi:hypothetical protein
LTSDIYLHSFPFPDFSSVPSVFSFTTSAFEDISRLQQQIGKLTVQVDWLKKSKKLPLDVRKKWFDENDGFLSLDEQLALSAVTGERGMY